MRVSQAVIPPQGGNLRSLKIGLVADELTRECLNLECSVRDLTPLNYRWVLRFDRPDLILVESAWNGYRGAWKYGIASYPEHPERNNRTLARLVSSARQRGIPCIFWNKEDGAHFDRFIASAKLFDTVFTVDENCIQRYHEAAPEARVVQCMMFPVQPQIHNFTGFHFKYHRANFVGSFSRHIHERRRERQEMLFTASQNLGLTVFDRNSDRKSTNYRYPPMKGLEVKPYVPHKETAQIYKDYLVSLNVNTVEDSGTMYSRRLVEILACGGIAVTTPAKSVDQHFKEVCHVVNDEAEATALLDRLSHGPSKDDLEKAEAGAALAFKEHNYSRRLEQMLRTVGLR